MALHPRCPCSRASVTTFSQIVPRAAGNIDFVVLVRLPRSRSTQWTESDTARQVGAIQGVRVIHDPDGRMAATFDMHTSGTVVAYDQSGQLAFAGGITAARGREGGEGARSLSRFVDQRGRPGGEAAGAPVFGCELANGPCGESD